MVGVARQAVVDALDSQRRSAGEPFGQAGIRITDSIHAADIGDVEVPTEKGNARRHLEAARHGHHSPRLRPAGGQHCTHHPRIAGADPQHSGVGQRHLPCIGHAAGIHLDCQTSRQAQALDAPGRGRHRPRLQQHQHHKR